jgi:hypothetical protein
VIRCVLPEHHLAWPTLTATGLSYNHNCISLTSKTENAAPKWQQKRKRLNGLGSQMWIQNALVCGSDGGIDNFIRGRCCVEHLVHATEAPGAAFIQSGIVKHTKTTGIHRPLPSISNQFQANRSNRDQPRPPCHHVAPCRNMPDHHHPP